MESSLTHLHTKIFLEGPAGSGKTTAAVNHLRNLLDQGVPGDSILIWVPQRTLADPYYAALNAAISQIGGLVTVLTIGGLARRMVDLFWPLVVEEAGFARPDLPPTFLTLETAQYYMAHLVRPLFDQGYFSSVAIKRPRLYSQILDNLNKAAAVGFAHTEIAERLQGTQAEDPGQQRIFADAQECANLYRQFCLDHNLLDFSLQLEVFNHLLWPTPLCREYLVESHRHLIVENIEEDIPIAHDILAEWLPQAESALVIYDSQAGYRRFLGADPESAYRLKALCQEQIEVETSLVPPEVLHYLGNRLGEVLHRPGLPVPSLSPTKRMVEEALVFERQRFYPEMLRWVAEKVAGLINDEGVPPGEIVVLAPYLPDSLRFSLTYQMETLGIPIRSHRPSRALRDEPVTECLLTLAQLAHPDWGFIPSGFDIAYTLIQAVQDLDLVRAQLLAEIVYRTPDGVPTLYPFDEIRPEIQQRISYLNGGRYEGIRAWIEAYRRSEPIELDIFLSRLFGELLSQPGYGFHEDYTAGEITANLIESIQKFRWATGDVLAGNGQPIGREYLEMVREGVIAALYIRSWQLETDDAVLLAPAYTFLMRNRPVDYQFWLDAGSRGWYERLYQPLTHPYVLRRDWPPGRVWTDKDEVEAEEDALFKLTLGLIRRSRKRIYLGLSERNDQGDEPRGRLLNALGRVLRSLPE